MHYPKRRYNIDGNLLWPRLKSILPKEFLQEKDDSEARLIFMLNSSLLAYGISGLSMLGGLFGVTCIKYSELSFCSSEFTKHAFSTISPIGYVVISALFALLGYYLYLLAVSAGETFTLYVRTSFDLYRFSLLKKLNLELPNDIEKEKIVWEKVNELLMAGDDLGISPLIIKYETKKNTFAKNK
jgi:hypothetical protein